MPRGFNNASNIPLQSLVAVGRALLIFKNKITNKSCDDKFPMAFRLLPLCPISQLAQSWESLWKMEIILGKISKISARLVKEKVCQNYNFYA